MNVGEWAVKRAISPVSRDKAAFVSDGKSYTYREFNSRVNRLANGLLSTGFSKGDIIAGLFFNCNQFMECYFAAAKLGLVWLPLNFRLTAAELAGVFADTGPRALFFHSEFAGTVAELTGVYKEPFVLLAGVGDNTPEFAVDYEEWISGFEDGEPEVVDPPGLDDPQMLMFTSGTTGKPKGALLPHRKTYWNTINDVMELFFSSFSISLVSIPIFHSGGINIITMPTFYCGGTVIFQKFFNPEETLKWIDEYRVTHFGAVPAMLQMMLAVPTFDRYDYSSLAGVGIGGSPASLELLNSIKDRMKLDLVVQVFGCTETSVVLYCSDMNKIGSAGLPQFHGDVRVLKEDGTDVRPGSGEVGEVVARGPMVMLGYWKDPEGTADAVRDGWFHFGDLATVDGDGYVYIVDRKKDMIISGGENIYPAEVEKALSSHPKIEDIAVIGIPDEKWGEVGHAIVVLRDPEDQLTRKELEEFCEGRLARFKIPAKMTFVQKIPRTLTGKILKKELRAQYGEADAGQ